MARRRRRLLCAIVFVALLVLALGACTSPPEPPLAVGGLPRTHLLDGQAARATIDRLHGRTIMTRDAFVAHYEDDGAVAMLYVSRALWWPLARWQFSKMVQGIGRGRASAEGRFTYLRAREQDGLTFYSALGLGQVHYFYRSGATIVWIAADPAVARRVLADTLRAIREDQGGSSPRPSGASERR